MKQNFDIYEYVHNNKFKLDIKSNPGTNTPKAYNDIRKTSLNEVKISGNKFDIKENLSNQSPKKEIVKETLTRKTIIKRLLSEGASPFRLAEMTDIELKKLYIKNK